MNDTKKIEYKDYTQDQFRLKVNAFNEIVIKCLAICHDYFFNHDEKTNMDLMSQLLKMSDKRKAMMYDRNKSYSACLEDWCVDLFDYMCDTLHEDELHDFNEDEYFELHVA